MTNYIIRFPNGSLLKKFLISDSLTTSEFSKAKLFTDEMKARAFAELLSGKIDEVEVPLNLNLRCEQAGDDMSDLEKMLTCLCQVAGSEFQGLQVAYNSKHVALVLFCDVNAPKEQRPTLALPIWELSSEAIQQRLAESRQRFAPRSSGATA